MHTTRSAILAGRLSLSASETPRTDSTPSSRQAFRIRTAISPLLATKTREIFAIKVYTPLIRESLGFHVWKKDHSIGLFLHVQKTYPEKSPREFATKSDFVVSAVESFQMVLLAVRPSI